MMSLAVWWFQQQQDRLRVQQLRQMEADDMWLRSRELSNDNTGDHDNNVHVMNDDFDSVANAAW